MSGFSRRTALGLFAGAGALITLAACGQSAAGDALNNDQQAATGYDAIITGAPKAAADLINGNPWAKAIKDRGALNWGGTKTSKLFSLEDVSTGKITGFDAGIVQMLATYILGAPTVNFTQVSVDTRETLLQGNVVDVVVATYSITPTRKEKINFAGPYYQSGTAIGVLANNTTVNGPGDLSGKTVITQANSTAVKVIQDKIPGAEILQLPDNAQCLQALQQARGEAYVIDQSLLVGAGSDGSIKVVGEPLSTDQYGIGCTKSNDDALSFINQWLSVITNDGTWQKLFGATLGTVIKETPEPPTIAS